MDWVMIIIGAGGGEAMALATAQFETKELCEAAAEWLGQRVKYNEQPAVVGLCVQAREGTG